MNHRSVFSNLHYLGLVQSVRRDYHVLEGKDHFVLLSPKKDPTGGNYTVVPRAAVAQILKRLGGRTSVTTADALAACKRSKFLGNRFAVLNALYAMIATEDAWIARVDGQTLHFGIRRSSTRRAR